jgi:hypothetical protein
MRIDRLKIRTYACALIFGSIVGQAGAQLIAYEGFDVTIPQDQTSVPLNGVSGTTSFGWQGNWLEAYTNTASIVSPGLQSPASGFAGIGNTAQTADTTANFYRFLDSGMLGTVQAGNDYFLSFLANRVGETGTSLTARIVFGAEAFDTTLTGNNQLVLSGDNFSSNSPLLPNSNSGNPFLVVTQIHINAIDSLGVANFTMTSSTPNNLDGPSTLTGQASAISSTVGDITIGSSSILFLTDVSSWAIDEVRFGRTLSDVYQPATAPVPEPTTLAVLALGAFGALRRRRQGS